MHEHFLASPVHNWLLRKFLLVNICLLGVTDVTLQNFLWQVLKKEISKSRIRLMEPLLKGPASLDYLRSAFSNRYGSPSEANASLPSTRRWLLSVWNCKNQEWEEHLSSSSALASCDSSSQGRPPSTTLRSGGSILVKTNGNQMSTDSAKTAG